MRYAISALAVGAALCLMGASGLMNFLFWLTQGQTEREANILGSVSVAFDIFKCVLPVSIAWAWAQGKRGYVLAGCILFALFFAFSFLSALGFAAGNRGMVSGGRESLGLRLEAASSELGNARLRLKDLNRQRPASVIEAEFKELQQDRFWKGSQNCANPSGGEAREFCKSYFGKRIELVAAVEAERLTRRIAELAGEVQTLKSQGAGEDKDPQASMLAVLSGLAPEKAQKILIVGFAFLVELGAAFGLFLATGHSFGGGNSKPVAGNAQGHTVLANIRDQRLLPQPAIAAPLRLKRCEGGGLIVDDGSGKA
ncbi:MAG: hypothetical protein ACLPPF_18650 [Rhodomicrobium sp.]